MKILAIVTAYNPEPDLLVRSIASYIDGVDTLLIWRNSPVDEKGIASKFADGKIVFCGDCTNAGIPKALNFARRFALENTYSHLLTIDQDSVWEDFKAFLGSATADSAPKGIFGPKINGTAGDPEYLKGMPAGQTYIPYPFILTSGMLISSDILKRAGDWDESFFVDGVDMQFVFQAREHGIESYRTTAGNLVHRLGDTRTKSFLGKKYTVHNYSPDRLHDLYCSHIKILRKYKSASIMAPLFRRQNYRQRPLRILLGEKDKFRKIAAIISGIRDGRRAAL